MPAGNPGAYSNPRSKNFIKSASKRKAKIRKNIAAKGKSKPFGLGPMPRGGQRKYLGK